MLKGTGVSAGIGMAQALIWRAPPAFEYVAHNSAQPAQELARFEAARGRLMEQTDQLRQKTELSIGSGEAAIFGAYLMILKDEDELLCPLRRLMQDDGYSAEYAVMVHFDKLVHKFMRLQDEYMRQRADDLFSLRNQLMRELMGATDTDASHLDRPTVILAHSLSPVDIVSMDLSRVEGIVCEGGGYSSHISMIARTMAIPAVMGCCDVLTQLRSGDMVALDGACGEVWISPAQAEIDELRKRGEALFRQRAAVQNFRGRPTVTADGRRVELSANVSRPRDVDAALAADAESLGLYRTEQMYFSHPHQMPDEEQQFLVYKALQEKLGGKAVTVRTFDGGGRRPKHIPAKAPAQPAPYAHRRSREENPIMGYRGVRMSLGRPSFFRTQLRALLRASAYGTLKVMFPMISGMDELDDALNALNAVKAELRREGVPFDEKLRVGVDIEVPGAALMSEHISRKVDFLSIGISDFIQFTLAIDRRNPDLTHLYHPYHPSVLNLVRWTVDAAHGHGIPCTLSGEAPGLGKVLPLLLGIGMDGFSMHPSLLLRSRRILTRCSYAECRDLADEILQLENSAEVAKRLTAFSRSREKT